MIKVTQEEVNEAVRLHGLWLKDSRAGERANFSNKNLSGLDFSGADLRNASLSGAYLIDVNLNNADLSGANLMDADFIGADLSGANLRRTDLRESILDGATYNSKTIFPDLGDNMIFKED